MVDDKTVDPDFAKMNVIDYVNARYASIPEETRVLLTNGDHQNMIELQRLFEREYERGRLTLLESNCKTLTRKYLSAYNALKKITSGEEAAKLLLDEEGKLPEEIVEIPEL